MDEEFLIWGEAGSGSTTVEAALTLIAAPYRLVEVTPKAVAAEYNPMGQVPALRTPDGAFMTESLAILVWLAETYPDARLSPPPADPARPTFLRWMAFVAAAIYAHYWARDVPARVIEDEAGQAMVKTRLQERIAHCWSVMNAGIDPGLYILGDNLSVLDIYVTVISRWAPGRRRFYQAAPKLADVVRRVDADPRLASFWAARFPFEDGWER